MKADIHPKYNKKVKVSCSCGHVFEVGSTKDELQIEVCSNCHPFYTGHEKVIDTAGRVERFKSRASKAVVTKTKKAVKVKK